jgi:exopolysaccharide biosynthesis protein
MKRQLVPLLALLPLALAAATDRAALLDVAVQDAEHYVEVELSFDRSPVFGVMVEGRVVTLTFSQATSLLTDEAVEGLRATSNTLIPEIVIEDQSFRHELRVNLQLNIDARPFVSRAANKISLRFYRGAQVTTQLTPDVSLVEQRHGGRQQNLTVFALHVGAASVGRLSAISAGSQSKSLLRPSQFAAQSRADVVINGGYFSKSGEHLSTLIEQGELVALGVYPTRPMLVIDTAGKAHIGRYEIKPGGTRADGPAGACSCISNEEQFDAVSAIGAGPMLVEAGRAKVTLADDFIKPDIAVGQRSRTAVGLTRKGELILIVVREDRPAEHPGVSLEQLAQLLLDAGAYTAMNFDGGGSSAIVVAGQLLNPDPQNERPVSNVLALRLGQESQQRKQGAKPGQSVEIQAASEAQSQDSDSQGSG